MGIRTTVITITRIPLLIVCFCLKLYRVSLSRLLPPSCRFYPSCSEYAELAFRNHGFFRGGVKSIVRIIRCAPWSRGGVDYP